MNQAALTHKKTLPLRKELGRLISRFDFNSRALLIQPPQVPFDMLDTATARNHGYFAYPPQGLLHLSASLRSFGVETRILDLNFEQLKAAGQGDRNPEAVVARKLERELRDLGPPLVCLSLMFESNTPLFLELCAQVRALAPGACVMAGGVSATSDPPLLLETGLVDLVLGHECALSVDTFYAYLDGEQEELPPNLSFRDSAGEIRATKEIKGGPVDIDIREEYALIPMREYGSVGSLSNFSRMVGSPPFAAVQSRRGCRSHCSFCAVRGFHGRSVRVRPARSVVDEMVLLNREYGVVHFDWLDDDLLYHRNEALEMFKLIQKELPGATWAANNGLIASAVTPELLTAMRDSGCVGYKIGLESGNPEVLRRIRKPTNLRQFYAFADKAKNFPSMFVSVNFIMGFPGERVFEMLDSFKAALNGGLDWNSFFIYQPLKNTDMYVAYGDGSGGGEDGDGREVGRNLNPVRGGAFSDYHAEQETLTGYDVLDLDRLLIPSEKQLKELWFTFNYGVNFMHCPAIRTESEPRLKNAVSWLDVLSKAYPGDAAMSALLYFLRNRLDGPGPSLERLRSEAREKFKQSEYWRFRDGQFNFSAFLDGASPPPDPRVETLKAEPPQKEENFS